MGEKLFSSKETLKMFVLESLNDLACLFKNLDHPTRLEILARLIPEEMEFGDLQKAMDIPKTSLANHLIQLTESGLIEKLDRGVYRISFDGEDIMSSSAKSFLDMKIREQERLETLRLHYESIISRYTYTHGEQKMEDNDKYRIVKLPPMRVVSFHEMGTFLGDPETKAFSKLEAWAKPKGILNAIDKHQVYGFNNPNPKQIKETGNFLVDEENPYGYEFWITIDDDFEVEKGVTVKDELGGLFVVTKCIGVQNLGEAWKDLYNWIKESKKYKFGKHQCLEHNLDPTITDDSKFEFDVYFPVTE
ncbi:MAG: effector binding domain-containing protein [Candidatus Heimdallarchaeota archaeon]|nr:effector binding domain-containing protein [Candidatus Heimdallarchaeota archaeon]